MSNGLLFLPLHKFFLTQCLLPFFVTDNINIMLPNTGDYIVDNAPNSEAAAFARVIGDMKTEVHFRCQLVLGTRGVKVTSLS